jgi:hypothetical protein
MRLEIALLEWTEPDGVRIVGRSADPRMVEAVRRHLHERLDCRERDDGPDIHVVPTGDDDGE